MPLSLLHVTRFNKWIDKKANLASVLEHESKQSRDKANQVMKRIMKKSGEEKAVSSSSVG